MFSSENMFDTTHTHMMVRTHHADQNARNAPTQTLCNRSSAFSRCLGCDERRGVCEPENDDAAKCEPNALRRPVDGDWSVTTAVRYGGFPSDMVACVSQSKNRKPVFIYAASK